MRIQNKHYTSIWLTDEDELQIIDQTKLPYQFEIATLKKQFRCLPGHFFHAGPRRRSYRRDGGVRSLSYCKKFSETKKLETVYAGGM